jgi:hypothetical protein
MILASDKGSLTVERLTIGYGALLVLTGVIAYVMTQASVTALIPAFLGGIVLLLGALAQSRPGMARGAVAAALVFALLAISGSTRGISGVIAMLGGETVARPVAAVAQSITLLLSLAFIVLAGRVWFATRAASVRPAA